MEEVPGRGYTNDLASAIDYQNNKAMTSTTPAIPQMRALARQIADVEASGGFAARYAKHVEMQALVLDWAAAMGLPVLAKEGFRSPTVTSIGCDGRFEIADLVAGYRRHGYFVGAGYGKTSKTHWRIGHMGDHGPDDVKTLLAATDEILAQIDSRAGAPS
jgi:aspartate aminotransferase-like enzyme